MAVMEIHFALMLVGDKKLVQIEAICYPLICSEINNQHIFHY